MPEAKGGSSEQQASPARGQGALHDKLRRLRRDKPKAGKAPDAEVEPGASASGSVPMPTWWLAREKGRRARRGSRAAGLGEAHELEAPPDVPLTAGPPKDLIRRENDHGVWHERVALFEPDYRHGDWALFDVDGADPQTLGRVTRDERLGEMDLRSAVYLDIETTGLSGGAGTLPFLVCLGRFEGERFELWQGFMGEPEEEAALLSETARRLETAGGIVSFFGKSFDRHRLEDKMRLHGVRPPFEALEHLDLYHPLSRLYRGALPDGRLGTMETALCGLIRPCDLSGRYAPEAWYDFLGDRAHRLEAVFQHNADDVLSLVVLAAHLGHTEGECRPDGSALEGCGAARARALGRLALEAGEPAQALDWLDRYRERAAGEDTEALGWRAEALKRSGDTQGALDVLERLTHVGETSVRCTAHIERAKLLEHGLRDYAAALLETQAAQELGCHDAKREAALAHRATRLERRLARSAAD